MPTRLLAVTLCHYTASHGFKTLTTDGSCRRTSGTKLPTRAPTISSATCWLILASAIGPEYIRVTKGKKLVLWINNVAQFKDPPIALKSGEPPVLDCSEKNKLIVKCKVSNDADTNRKYGYTINLEGRDPYDPFVWPR